MYSLFVMVKLSLNWVRVYKHFWEMLTVDWAWSAHTLDTRVCMQTLQGVHKPSLTHIINRDRTELVSTVQIAYMPICITWHIIIIEALHGLRSIMILIVLTNTFFCAVLIDGLWWCFYTLHRLLTLDAQAHSLEHASTKGFGLLFKVVIEAHKHKPECSHSR